MLKAARSTEGKMTFKGIASSTTRDLHGDTMLATALEDMERAANNNLTIFLNHSYNVPEDVGGSVTKAKMLPRGVDGEGNPNYDLDFDIDVNASNPRAVQAFEAIESGTKLGLSIGAMIPEGGAVRDKKSGTFTIAHVELLETSIVGIPANPRSWVQNAVKSLNETISSKGTTTHPLGSPTLTLDGDHYRIEGSLNNGGLNLSMPTPEELKEAPPADDTLIADDVAPDVQDAKIRIIEVDTDEASDDSPSDSQEAPRSEPGDEHDYAAEPAVVAGGEPAGDIVASATDALETGDGEVLVTQLQGVLDLVRSTTDQLVEARRTLGEEQIARKAAEQARDQAYDEAGQIVLRTSEILEKLADMPLGRKATLRAAQTDLSHLEGTYSAEFLKMLRGANTP